MAEEQKKGKNWGAMVTTPQNGGGVFLPGITGNSGVQEQKKDVVLPGITTKYPSTVTESVNNEKSNVVLPGITSTPQSATMDTASMETQRRANIRANNNNVNKQSIDEQKIDKQEREFKKRYLSQLDNVAKKGLKSGWNSIKKFVNGIIIDDKIKRLESDKKNIGKNDKRMSDMYRSMGRDDLADKFVTSDDEKKAKIESLNKEIEELKAGKGAYIEKVNNSLNEWMEKNLDMEVYKDFSEKNIRDLLGNGDIVRLLYGLANMGSESAVTMVPSAAVGIITKNPQLAGRVMFASSFPQIYQETYEEAKEYKLTEEQAKETATWVGLAGSYLEKFGFGKVFKGVFTPKKGGSIPLTQIFLKTLYDLGEAGVSEGTTEAGQEFLKNLGIWMNNKDKGLFDNVVESGVWGALLGMGFNGATAPINVAGEISNSKKMEEQIDIEAMNYVMETEQRKAKRARWIERRNARKGAKSWGDVQEIDSKFQTQGNNSGNGNRNDYTDGRDIGWESDSNRSTDSMYISDNTVSEDYSHSDMKPTDSIFSMDEKGNYINYNGGKLYAGNTINSKNGLNGKYNKSMFSGVEYFTKNPQYDEYRQNFYDFLKKLEKKITEKTQKDVVVGKTESGADMKLSRKVLKKIIKLHGAFSLNDFLETVNNPDYSRNRGDINSDGPFYMKNIPNSDKFYYLGFKKNSDGSYDINTFFEITKDDAQGKLNYKLNNSVHEVFQENGEENTPGVADRNEKTISALESLTMKDILQGQTIEEFAEKYGIPIRIVEQILTPAGKKAYGKYGNGLVTLAELIKESSAPHELMHAVFDMVDPETRVYLISQTMQSEGWTASQAEEWLADSFANFFRTGKIEKAPKSTWGKIKIFFKRVRGFINGMNKFHNQLEKMFRDILEANGIEDLQSRIDEDKSLNRSKEKMRERFKRYKERAEKRRNNHEKYQETEENSGNEEKNNYTTPDKGGAFIPGKTRVQSAPFSFGKNEITFNGKTLKHTPNKNLSFKTDYIFNVPQDLQQYVDYFNRSFTSGSKSAIIGEFGGRYIKFYFDKNFEDHFEKHGGFDPENLVMTVNKFDDFTVADDGRYIFQKELPNGNWYVAITTPNLSEITFYERKNKWVNKNSSEKHQEAGDTESEAFKKRFGDSKVVDENGKPLVVYHGTRYDIKIPNMKKGIFQAYGNGMYFTTNKKGAEYYANEKKNLASFLRKPRVMEVYLSIQNPIKEGVYNWDNKWIDELKNLGYEINELYLSNKDIDIMGKYTFLWMNQNKEQRRNFTEDFSKITGYDGLVAPQPGGEDYWVAFNPNQIKSATDNVGTYDPNNDDIRYQEVEYDYDEEGNRTNIKFEEDNSEFDPSIFGEPTREEQMAEDKENLKDNPFYDAWIKYNNQNYKDDQLTFDEFMEGVMAWSEKEQDIYDKKMKDLNKAQNDPKMLELQLKAVKLLEEEQNVGKKFGKNVSKEVRDRQQAEVEKKREDLTKEIYDWMYPGLSFKEATYDDMKSAYEKEAEWELLGKENIEEKLKYFKKDKNGNWEAKNIKIESPQEKRDKIVKAGRFDEVFEQLDRVIEWKTPEGQRGRLDSKKDLAKYKKTMEKINAGNTKTKVTLRDVTVEQRALEKTKAMEEEEKARKKKEREEAFAKKKQDEYKKIVIMKAFQRLVDMQRFEKYPFLSEKDIQERYGFTDEEWDTITEQKDVKVPKKWGEKAISDLNKAVDSKVRDLIEGLSWQNNMKRKDAEKDLGEIGEIDLDVLLGRDEEKGQKEMEEFEKVANEEMEGAKEDMKKRLDEARENVMDVEIDKERENDKSEKEKVKEILSRVKGDESLLSKTTKRFGKGLATVDYKIREISKPIYESLMRYFQNTAKLTNQRMKEITPFINAMKKIKKDNIVRYMDIWVALANRNIGYANGLLKEYGVTVPTELLDTIYDEVQDVGINMNYLGSYFPLSVESPKSLLTEIMNMEEGDFASEIDKRVKEESEKNGGPLDESQISSIIAEIIAGEEKGPDVRIGNAHMKERNTNIEWTPEMLKYCYDPVTTLIGYVEGMTQSIERAKFLGKSRSGQVRDLGTYVYNTKNGLTREQQDELMGLLQAVFNDEPQSEAWNTWRDWSTFTTLGSPTSTLTQIGDLGFSLHENGLVNTWKALWGMGIEKGLFNLEDMGIVNRGEEFTNINEKKTWLQKGINVVFKATGFSRMDLFGKGMYIKSTWLKWQKWAKVGEKGDAQLRKDIMRWTDDEYVTDKIINDLRHGVFSDEISMIMFMKLSNFQPLTKAQMPKAYLNNPGYIRMLYQFKTFGLKQANYIVNECKEAVSDAKKGGPKAKREAVGRIVSLVTCLSLMGLAADELKDLLMRRRNESMILRAIFGDGELDDKFIDKFTDNLLKLVGLSRYAIMNLKNDPVGVITSIVTDISGLNSVNYPYRDIRNWINGKDEKSQSVQLVPVVGKWYYWAFGGGQDKQQQALEKERKAQEKSSGSSRRNREDSRKNRNASRKDRSASRKNRSDSRKNR